MKLSIVSISIAATLQLFTLNAHAEKFDKEAAIAEAKATTKAFGGALKKELIAAMQAGGPVNALGVCNTEAMPITAKSAEEHGANVFRVSLKNRNPNNVPNEWQAMALADFDKRAAAGEDIATMAAVDVIDMDGKKQLRFMKALPTEGACLACHGQQVGPDVQAKLDELYPEDKATGYSLGEVRGAIVVIKDYDQ